MSAERGRPEQRADCSALSKKTDRMSCFSSRQKGKDHLPTVFVQGRGYLLPSNLRRVLGSITVDRPWHSRIGVENLSEEISR